MPKLRSHSGIANRNAIVTGSQDDYDRCEEPDNGRHVHSRNVDRTKKLELGLVAVSARTDSIAGR